MLLASCITKLVASLLKKVPQFLMDSVNKLWRILSTQLEVGSVEVKEASLICLREMLRYYDPPPFAADELLFCIFSLLSLDSSVDSARSSFRTVSIDNEIGECMKLLIPFVSREGLKSVVSLLKDCILVNLKASKSKDLMVIIRINIS